MGTRLLSATKEQPKEMLPIFARGMKGDLCLKPIVQLIFEQLYTVGFREFCFIVGRGKRAIEDLQAFYRMVDDSTLVWINQPAPRGFGDAVLKAKGFAGNDRFLVHAGDSYFLSKNAEHLRRLVRMSEEYKADTLFLSKEVEDPKQFGIVEGETIANGLVKVKHLVEKPAKPASRLAIMPVYVFDPVIFKALESTKTGFAGELQLTDGIQKIVDWNLNVYTTQVDPKETWLDIGSPDLYWEAQSLSYKHSKEPAP